MGALQEDYREYYGDSATPTLLRIQGLGLMHAVERTMLNQALEPSLQP